MDRRTFLSSLAAGAATATWARPGRGADASPPNIVLIMADDLGYGELGCYGQAKIETPRLDALAAQGLRATQAYTAAPVCAPARCSLLTGRHGGHAYIRDNYEIDNPAPEVFGGQLPLPRTEVTVAERLRAAGYTTGCFGKWGLGNSTNSGDPLLQGFDRFYGYLCQRHAHNYYPRYLVDQRERVPLAGNDRGVSGQQYAPERIGEQARAFVRDNASRPFFLYYPTVIPHLALQVPEPYVARYRGRWEETPYTGRSYQPHPEPRSAYAGMITYMDEQVGRLLDTLEAEGVAGNTLVIFTSDNGTTHVSEQVDAAFFDSLGGLRGYKGSVYEGGIRVPFIARWPGQIAAGRASDHPLAHYDLYATLCDIAGAEPPRSHDGLSLRPLLQGDGARQPKHAHLYWEFGGYGGHRAVRRGPWKLLQTQLRRRAPAALELYNLEQDPHEQEDVAEAHPDVVAALQEIMRTDRTEPEVERFRLPV